MTITYAITVCNEFVEIQTLVHTLLSIKRYQDNIVILYDSENGDKEVESYLRSHSVNGEFTWYSDSFKGHFADWKNKLTGHCTGDYIFQIDADEVPHKALIVNLPAILEANPNNEVYFVPRVNTVEGLTDEHIQKWRWRVDDKGWVNWPDYQMRIWKNVPEIKWRNKVHEVLEGHINFSALPAQEELSLYHPKTIDRQERQNTYYETLG